MTHLDRETLAELVDGTLAADAAERARAHLAACPHCAADYAEAVGMRATLLAAPERLSAPAGFDATPGPMRVVTPARRRAGPSWRAAVVAAAAAAFIAVLWTSRPAPAPTLGFALPPSIRAATERSSALGLVLPGGERMADAQIPPMRGGAADSSPGMERELDSLLSAYERGAPTPELAARVVAGQLAANDVAAATNYAREALRRDPRDVRLLVLAAAADYRANDLRSAEERLRLALKRAPRDPIVALDLGIVLGQGGKDAEAKALFDRAARGRESAVSARARREVGPR